MASPSLLDARSDRAKARKGMISKSEAKYLDDAPTGHRCGNCDMFLPKRLRCTLVEGVIKAGAVCKHWERRSR